MIGYLYRYCHPSNPSKILYVGQGKTRDYRHRNGKSSFGRRFKKRFPASELPQPIHWTVEVQNQLELNEEETIAMFRFHSYHWWEGGMNLSLPGSLDYKILGKMSAIINRQNKTSAVFSRTQEQQKANSVFLRNWWKNMPLQQKEKHIENFRNMGKKFGNQNVINGHLAIIRQNPKRLSNLRAKKQGVRAKESGQIQALGKTGVGGKISRCLRWNIKRNKPCICGVHK